jgi:cell division protein ZipA
MIEGIIAIILLVLAAGCYWWGRGSTEPMKSEDPDVILGLAEPQELPSINTPETEPVPLEYEPETTAIPQPEHELEPEPVPVLELKPSPPLRTAPLEREILLLRAPPGRPFSGYELLQSLLTCGLRFGENNIFHRYEQNPEGPVILFSVAAATPTGELKPADMGDFNCPGLSLFITLNHHIYPSVNFELMLDTARQLMEDLGGTLLDVRQSLLTADKIQQIREKIKLFETSQQTMELFT